LKRGEQRGALRSSELNDLEKPAILGGNASRFSQAIPSFAKGDLKGRYATYIGGFNAAPMGYCAST
jgi:hypothetical protein